MPCYPFQLGETTGIICARGERPSRCSKCGRTSEIKLCDYPLRKKDCDVRICETCAKSFPNGADSFDYCPQHAEFIFAIGDRKLIVVNNHSVTEARNDGIIVDVMRGTPLGKPFKVSEFERAEVLQKYREFLWQQLKKESGQKQELQRILGLLKEKDVWLSCCCAPRLCHAQIIAKAIEWLSLKGDL